MPGEVVAGLLYNIYRAFDFRDEEQIYDVPEQSVEGRLLGACSRAAEPISSDAPDLA
jgi:hypothetical protein